MTRCIGEASPAVPDINLTEAPMLPVGIPPVYQLVPIIDVPMKQPGGANPAVTFLNK